MSDSELPVASHAHRDARLVVIVTSTAGTVVRGGRLYHMRQGLERHSYEAELAGFHDHLAATSDTYTVFVTDCLSGSMAGQSWRRRTHAAKGGRYRSQELDNLERLENGHRGVVYLWVHSHVGGEGAHATRWGRRKSARSTH